MRNDRSAMALMFDSLVFLTIISVIGAALMGSALLDDRSQWADDYVRSAHEVALQCSFQGEGVRSLMDIEDAAIWAISCDDKEFLKNISEQMGTILESYLSPLYIFYYEVEKDGISFSFGNESVLGSDDIYVSSIESKEGARFTLSVAFA